MTWNSDTTYALGLQKIIAQILGIWPTISSDMSSKMRVTFVIIVQVWIFINIVKQLTMKEYCGSIIELVDIISTIITVFTIALKMIVVTVYRRNLYVIINSAVSDWSMIVNEKSRSIMLQYARMARIVLIIQIFGVFTISCQIIFDRIRTTEMVWNSVLNSSIELHGVPLWPTCWIPSDITANDLTMYFIVQSIGLIVFHNSYAIFNVILYSLAIHICGQFQVLDNNLKHFHEINDVEQYKRQLNEFVRRHNHLITLANMFEETYNLNILIELGMDILIICISGIVLLIGIQSSNFDTVSAMAIRIFMLNIGIFAHSCIGEQLYRKTEKFYYSIYNISWYNMPPNVAKDIIIIMMRCKYPFNLTAGKIYNINFYNYMAILKTIFSYFSVIRLMFE